jgi:hypothetical protein
MGFVLGLCGPAGAGKDTVADYLVSKHGWTEKLSFASNLKKMCKAIFFLSDYDVNDQEGKQTNFNRPRPFTGRNLGSVLHWMSRTHASYPLKRGVKEKVRSLVGTEFTNPRHILQFIGTDICRELVPSYHVDMVVREIKASPEGFYVITDARFPDEGDLVLDDLSGMVVYIDRPALLVENIDRRHASETALLNWGRFSDTINNHRDGLAFLYEEVDNFLGRHGLCQMLS